MRDAVADALHLLHQALDFLQHAVDHVDQPIEIPGSALCRQPPREIAIHDMLGGGSHGIDTANRIDASDRRARQAQQAGNQAAPREGTDQDFVEMTRIGHILGDEQQIAGWRATSQATIANVFAILRQREFEWLAQRRFRQFRGRQVEGRAADPVTRGIKQGEGPLRFRIRYGVGREALKECRLIQLGKTDLLAVEPVIRHVHQVTVRLCEQECEQPKRRRCKQQQEQQREPEARRSRQISQAHGACIRSPERYRSMACLPSGSSFRRSLLM